VLQRLFSEHFHLAADAPQPKAAGELTAASLQSVDDLEATYRSKRGQGYRGYVANVTETCDPENELQLITKVQVAPNNVDDDQLLAEALPNLKARTDVESLRTDGGYGGAASDPLLQQHGVELLQSAIRGRQPNPEQFHLADFEIRLDENGAPLQLTCPQGQPAAVQLSSRKKSFVADFAPEVCAACPLAKQCPAKPGKRHPRYRLRFTQTQAQAALRRQRHRALTPAARNLRAAVEATVRSVKHPFPGGKLPVRGRLRVTCLLLGSAAITNIRRITRYRKRQKQPPRQPKNTQNQPIEAPKTGDTPFLSLLRTCWRCLLAPHRSVCPLAGC
jgi:hypothetical protein